MQKHAYLIIAHKNENDLIKLIKTIDDFRNDIYIHLDKKWKDVNKDNIKSVAKSSNIFFIEKRLSVKWGGDTLIKVELLLFETAALKNYNYYHLLSGQDICIKTQDEIHKFFERNAKKEFLHFEKDKLWEYNAQNRVKFFYISAKKRGVSYWGNKILFYIQKLFGVNRIRRKFEKVYGGSEWCSITDDFCQYLVSKKKEIFKIFSHTFCADEIYKQTLLYYSKFKENLFVKYEENNNFVNLENIREIDWNRGSPYIFDENDFNFLINSPCMFARKVTSENKLPDMILNYLTK